MLGSYLRRGMAAGLLAGLLAGLFAFIFGERFVESAIQLEQATGDQGGEIFSRSTQKLGLFFATGLFGVTVGGLFGLAYACFRDHLLSDSEWNCSLSLAGAIFAGAFLIPFVKYPANPPTVGDPTTIGERTASYLTMGLGVVVAIGALFLILPAAPDPGEFPSGLLWSFRLSSLGTQLVFWTGLGVVFGLFCERADRRKPLES